MWAAVPGAFENYVRWIILFLFSRPVIIIHLRKSSGETKEDKYIVRYTQIHYDIIWTTSPNVSIDRGTRPGGIGNDNDIIELLYIIKLWNEPNRSVCWWPSGISELRPEKHDLDLINSFHSDQDRSSDFH